MADTAAYPVDHVILRVPVRQWVLLFPLPLCYLFVPHPHLLSLAVQVVSRTLFIVLDQAGGIEKPAGLDRRGDAFQPIQN